MPGLQIFKSTLYINVYISNNNNNSESIYSILYWHDGKHL